MSSKYIFLATALAVVILAANCNASSRSYWPPSRCGKCRGEKGDRGYKGYPGPMGCKGDPGPAGKPGRHGPPGYPGRHGLKGQKGDPGKPIVIKGIKGCKGDPGGQGPNGFAGDIGPQGPKGTPGRKGPPGLKGYKGDKGERGLPGIVGVAGAQGIKGDYGYPGRQGPKGDTGEPGIKGERGSPGPQAQMIKGEKGDRGENGLSYNGGSTYIRWGKSTCEGGQVVYNGVAVARQGTNPICLPNYDQSNDDISLKNVPPVFDFDQPGRASIEGQSQTLSPVGVRHDNNVQSNLLCALCFLPNLATPTLIVGTHRCPNIGVWRMEYYGQLVTTSSDYICVDLEQATQRPVDVDLEQATLRPVDGDSPTSSNFAYLLQSVNADCQGSPTLGCAAGNRFEEIPCAICTRIIS